MAIKRVAVSDLGGDTEVKADISDSASLGQGSRGECWVDVKGDRWPVPEALPRLKGQQGRGPRWQGD